MTHLIHVGNSLGVRIPKAIIAQVGFKEDMDLVFKITNEGLLISPIKSPRKGWAESFKMAEKDGKADLLLGEEIINYFDEEEWEW